jgi:hypothetical protein
MIDTKTIAVALVMAIGTIGVAAIGTGIAQAVCLEATSCAPPPPPAVVGQNAQVNTQLSDGTTQLQQGLQMTGDRLSKSDEISSNILNAQQQSQNNIIQNIR